MAKIHINNPKQVINGGAKKYYFKVKGLGGPKGDKGDKGDTGSQGPQGPQGNAATVSVGSTTTLPVGQDATVQNVGTLYNAVLNFGIPQGPRGPQGATGAKGDKGDKGDQGNPGPQGEKGTNATVYVGTTSTLNPGSQARVYNSGTDSNAVLNFEIPRGDVGPSVPLVQETGNSTTKAMSQNATTEALNGKQNTLTAGSNITISGNTISAKDTTYTAGDNIQINGSTISATDTTYTAGANIQIENGTISATDTTYTAGNGLNLNGTEFSADTDVLATKEDLEDYYTKPEADNLLAPKLEAEVVTELPTTGAEGKLYLTPKAHTTQTATGNPIEATITEQAGKLESFQLDGVTFQQTYTGKNLVGGTLEYLKSINTAGTWSGDVYTVNGMSWKPIFSNGLLDRVEATGTAISAGVGAFAIRRFTATEFWGIFNSTDTYTLSGCPSGGSSSTYYARVLASPPWTEVATDIGSGVSKVFNNIPSGANTIGLILVVDPPAGAVENLTFRPQLEKSATATSYEPYVGGIPSPNPDYPQPIQTVTGEQTVTVVGKNLFNADTTPSSQYIDSSGNWVTGVTNGYANQEINATPSSSYTVSFTQRTGFSYARFAEFDASGTFLKRTAIDTSPTTVTLTSNTAKVIWSVDVSSGANFDNLQIELGSTSTAYTPYSKQTLPLNLGSLELCKIGTYKDYIYKDGDSWKVHKDVGVVVYDGSNDEGWSKDTSGTYNRMSIFESLSYDVGAIRAADSLCDHFRADTVNAYGIFFRNNRNIYFYPQGSISLISEWRTWLSSNNIIVCYPLNTATDTTITDTTLIAQLEAIRTAMLQNGTNTITNTATGSNLAGDMEIGYFGFNPTNRYDKFIWLDLNNNYEQIGGE